MINTLFLQSEVKDPYALYELMLQKHPVYWDAANNLWAIYSYEGCRAILENRAAQVPPAARQPAGGLNDDALRIIGRLARLHDGAAHAAARQAVALLFENMRMDGIGDAIRGVLSKEMDWQGDVCKRLPVAAVARSFAFSEEDSRLIADAAGQLVKIMLPVKTAEQVKDINAAVGEVCRMTEKHLLKTGFYKNISRIMIEQYQLEEREALALFTGNLIGLFIQSYDAGRGLLSNALLQMLRNESLEADLFTHEQYLEKIITETLRFDPPVQHTRRLAASDITIGDTVIKKGDAMLVVMAAANRDPGQFKHPDVFNPERAGNGTHLTFGAGGHRCPAHRFSVQLTVKCLSFLFSRYSGIRLLQKDIDYEPLTNLRLPKNIFITLQ